MDYMGMLFTEATDAATTFAKADAMFLETISSLRSALGVDRNILDDYVIAFLRVLDSNCALFMRDFGFDTVATEFRYLLRIYRDNPTQTLEHPFFSTMQKYVLNHPCPNEGCFVEYYFVKLMPLFLPVALQELGQECRRRISDLFSHISIHHKEVALRAHIAEQEYDSLNHVLIDRFILVPAVSVFLQILIDETTSAYVTNCANDGEYLYHVIFDEV